MKLTEPVERIMIIKNKLILIFCIITLFSCKSQKEEERENIKSQSSELFKSAIEDIHIHSYPLNDDSLTRLYEKISKESLELGLEFALKIKEKVEVLNNIEERKLDSINRIAEAKSEKEHVIEQKKWENTKVGRVQKKHPEWSEEDCERIAAHQIWIGMSIKMLVYERGNPNSANPSNYGDGVNWQWCWYNWTPSCFYGEDDGIITSYN